MTKPQQRWVPKGPSGSQAANHAGKSNAARSEFSAQERLRKLCGAWQDQRGSKYELTLQDETGKLFVSTTRPSGEMIRTNGLIRIEGDEQTGKIVWGANRSFFVAKELNGNALLWERNGSAPFKWSRQDRQDSAQLEKKKPATKLDSKSSVWVPSNVWARKECPPVDERAASPAESQVTVLEKPKPRSKAAAGLNGANQEKSAHYTNEIEESPDLHQNVVPKETQEAAVAEKKKKKKKKPQSKAAAQESDLAEEELAREENANLPEDAGPSAASSGSSYQLMYIANLDGQGKVWCHVCDDTPQSPGQDQETPSSTTAAASLIAHAAAEEERQRAATVFEEQQLQAQAVALSSQSPMYVATTSMAEQQLQAQAAEQQLQAQAAEQQLQAQALAIANQPPIDLATKAVPPSLNESSGEAWPDAALPAALRKKKKQSQTAAAVNPSDKPSIPDPQVPLPEQESLQLPPGLYSPQNGQPSPSPVVHSNHLQNCDMDESGWSAGNNAHFNDHLATQVPTPEVEQVSWTPYLGIDRDLLLGLQHDLGQDLNIDSMSSHPRKVADRVKCTLSGVLRTLAIGGKVEPFGSFLNGVKTSDSDLDIVVHANIKHDERCAIFARIAPLLHDLGFENVTQIYQSKIPLLKFTDKKTNVEVDFCINNSLGLRNSMLLDAYCMYDQRVPMLGRLVKIWAKRHELVGTVEGCLNSYAYMLLVIHFLQSLQPPLIPNLQEMAIESCPVLDTMWGTEDWWETKFFDNISGLVPSPNRMSLSELIIAFFNFFGREFDWFRHAVCIRLNGAGRFIDKYSLVLPIKEEMWYVEDPFNLKHNLAAQCTPQGIKRMLSAMQSSAVLLQSGTPWMEVSPPALPLPFYMKCSIGQGVTPLHLLKEFEPYALVRLHFSKHRRGAWVPDAFLEFSDAFSRRRAYTRNECCLAGSPMLLFFVSHNSLREALDSGSFTTYDMDACRRGTPQIRTLNL